MTQVEAFLAGEGNAWFARNRSKLGQRDRVSNVLAVEKIVPKRVLEIGCANGWRLKKMREKYGCEAQGIEPSREAASEDPRIICAGAEIGLVRLRLDKQGFDLVIFGFCLYLIDRERLFSIAAAVDHVLEDRGYLVIHDFVSPEEPFAVPYEHLDGILSYHMDHAALWRAHPFYRHLLVKTFDDEQVDLLRKDTGRAFPVRAI